MAGCMTESTVGISGLVQIAPLLDYLDADGRVASEPKDIAVGAAFQFRENRTTPKRLRNRSGFDTEFPLINIMLITSRL